MSFKPLFIIALVVLSGLTGCSNLQTRESQSTRGFAANAALEQWQLGGKIGLKSSDSASSGYLNWQQCSDRFEIRINGPLGSGAAKLTGNDRSVTLFQNNQPPITAPSPEQLLQQQLGWQLPLSQLKFWVRGVPDPRHPFRHTELGFKQSGWTLSYPRQTQVGDYLLPAKALAANGDVRVTMIFQQWQLQPECALP